MKYHQTMEFGKLPSVDHIDWTLPPDVEESLRYLEQIKDPVRPTQFYIGTPAWGHREWVGKIYPPGVKAADYLKYYAKNFNTIELNTSHYRIPTAEQCERRFIGQIRFFYSFFPL
jgi:hypothetical protein